MGNSNFDDLLHRYLTDQVTEQERRTIEAWLDLVKSEDNDDFELSAKDEERLFKRITSDDLRELDLRIARNERKRLYRKIRRIAAGVTAIVVAAAFFVFLANERKPEPKLATRYEAPNPIKKLILNDGSIVWLRDNTSFAYFHKEEDGTTHRHVRIDGEGLFEVVKDPTRPFIITCGEVRIQVVGTSFNLKTDGDEIEVSVLTGKVSISSATDTTVMIVEPNEKVIYRGDGQFEKTRFSAHEGARMTEGTRYKMKFINASMADIIAQLEAKFDVDFHVTNEGITQCFVTLDLTGYSLEKSLELLTEILHVEYTLDEKNVTLSGAGC